MNGDFLADEFEEELRQEMATKIITKRFVGLSTATGMIRRDLSFRNTCTIFVQVDDMLLMKWQFQNESLSQDSDYYLGSDYYWDIYWNSTELKYQIPFEKHPNPDAQVCSSFKFNFYISLI